MGPKKSCNHQLTMPCDSRPRDGVKHWETKLKRGREPSGHSPFFGHTETQDRDPMQCLCMSFWSLFAIVLECAICVHSQGESEHTLRTPPSTRPTCDGTIWKCFESMVNTCKEDETMNGLNMHLHLSCVVVSF